MKLDIFTSDELQAIVECLNQFVVDGFVEDDSDPIMTALAKIEGLENA